MKKKQVSGKHRGCVGGHQYQIVNAAKNPVREVFVENRSVKLDNNGSAYVFDEGLAQEIDCRYGPRAKTTHAGQLVVIPVSDSDPGREYGHQYTFSVPDLSRFKGWGESRST
jgi:hypothetical protein